MAGFSSYIYSDPSIDSADLWLPIMVSLIFFHDVNGFSEGLQLQPGIEYLLRHINSKIESLPLWPPLLFLRIIWFNFHEICRIKLRKTCVVLSFIFILFFIGVFAFGRDIVIWFKNLIIVLSTIICQVVSAVELVDHWKLKTELASLGLRYAKSWWELVTVSLAFLSWPLHLFVDQPWESSHSNLGISWTLLI